MQRIAPRTNDAAVRNGVGSNLSNANTPRALAVLAAFALCAIAGTTPAIAAPPAHVAEEFAAGEVIVQFKPGVGPLDKGNAFGRASASVREEIETDTMKRERAPGLVRLSTRLPVLEAVESLRKHPAVAFAEPNYACRLEAVANDSYYSSGSTWGLYSDDSPTAAGPANTTNQFGSQAEEAWLAGKVGSRSVYVGVVDEGVDFSHPDLAANVWTNPHDPVDGVDNDGNGYKDDIHGWDFFNNDNSVYDGGTGDRHGTHVAGTIGARANNSVGVAGVCWDVTIVPLKFMGPTGGYISGAVKALDYATGLKTRHGLNVVATNNSWSTTGYSQSLHDATIRAAKQGILTVCAAGNDSKNNDAVVTYPANHSTTQGTSTQSAATFDGVISVAALDRYGALASFSNYGATSVDMGAPGVGILSTLPGNTYGNFSGTSMASPHVAGAAALVAAANPGMLASQLRTLLVGRTRSTASLNGKTASGGRLDISASLGGTGVVRDVAVTGVTRPAYVTKGATATIAVSLANQGNSSETFTVTLVDQPPTGGTMGVVSAPRTVTVAAGSTSAAYFTWSTSAASPGAHVLKATASTVPGETDLGDNSAVGSSTVVSPSAPPILTGVSPNIMRKGTTVSVKVTGGNFAVGAKVSFVNGAGATPVAGTALRSTDGQTLTANVTVGSSGNNQSQLWTVKVTNPNGTSASLAGGFLVTP